MNGMVALFEQLHTISLQRIIAPESIILYIQITAYATFIIVRIISQADLSELLLKILRPHTRG